MEISSWHAQKVLWTLGFSPIGQFWLKFFQFFVLNWKLTKFTWILDLDHNQLQKETPTPSLWIMSPVSFRSTRLCRNTKMIPLIMTPSKDSKWWKWMSNQYIPSKLIHTQKKENIVSLHNNGNDWWWSHIHFSSIQKNISKL